MNISFATKKIISKYNLVKRNYWNKFMPGLLLLRFPQVLDKFLKLNSCKAPDISMCENKSSRKARKWPFYLLFSENVIGKFFIYKNAFP